MSQSEVCQEFPHIIAPIFMSRPVIIRWPSCGFNQPNPQVPQVQMVEKIIELPQVQIQEKVVPVPQVVVQEVVKEVPRISGS